MMSGDSQPPPSQRILLVTGLSGAGKTTALQVLEDLGWEAIDNFPVRLLSRLIGDDKSPTPLAIGFDSRTRGFAPADIIALCKRLNARPGIARETNSKRPNVRPGIARDRNGRPSGHVHRCSPPLTSRTL